MGLFSSLFRQKQNDKFVSPTDVKKQPDVLTTETNFEFYEKIVEVIVVSETLKNKLKTRLKQAFEKPNSFYDVNNNFILSERGLTYPKDKSLTPKFVLIDILQDNNQMAEVDWKEEEEDIRFALNRILEAKNYGFISSEASNFGYKDTLEMIELINKEEIKSLGYSVEMLDINSDSYVFTVVPLERQQEVAAMFAKLK
ncbi:hypothetical protein GXP67_07245 [Rhodocytophaga rosea]|uniref:DUF6630 domain-containing protein n=1 Tax=Rhodocytophaga rosea TaxID=2704465 RepID=A0A6C0GF85_9BACT|nr:hypothetical protein [Rhodocytophaga rosea]QHT66464.1 hypothetical protein GXP67_07245 [Rhodocytophaga rosea]